MKLNKKALFFATLVIALFTCISIVSVTADPGGVFTTTVTISSSAGGFCPSGSTTCLNTGLSDGGYVTISLTYTYDSYGYVDSINSYSIQIHTTWPYTLVAQSKTLPSISSDGLSNTMGVSAQWNYLLINSAAS